MFSLPPRRFRAAMVSLLVVATAALALGIDRLVAGSTILGWGLFALGGLAVTAAFNLELAGDPRRTTVLLLTRDECPLCDEARIIAQHVQEDLGFALWEVDVAQEPELAERYGDQLPVLMADGQVVASLQVSEEDLRAAVAAPGTGSQAPSP